MKQILFILSIFIPFIGMSQTWSTSLPIQYGVKYIGHDVIYTADEYLTIVFEQNGGGTYELHLVYFDDAIDGFEDEAEKGSITWEYTGSNSLKVSIPDGTGKRFFYNGKILDNNTIKLDGWMKLVADVKQPVQNNYDDVNLLGYYCFWNDYRGKKSEGDNGTLTIETRTNHYIGVMHKNNITNISPNRYKRIRWSTRRGAIKVNLPKGVAIGQNDKIICWETNGSSSDPDYRVVVLFAWNPSTHTLQCLRTVKRHYNGKTINDWYYFNTTEANAWSKIQSKIMSELPHCGTCIE